LLTNLKSVIDTLLDPVTYTDEELALAQQALDSLKAREGEDVEQWAAGLAASLCLMTD
jgi:hypothetical protein